MWKKIVTSALALGAVGLFTPATALDVETQYVHEHLDDEESYGRRTGGGVFERHQDDDCPGCTAADDEDEGCGCPARPARRISGWGR